MKKIILKKIRKGFTPLELLMVIGISAVVAGLFIFASNAPQQQAALPPINVNVEQPNITVNPPDVNVNVEPAQVSMDQPNVNVNMGAPKFAKVPARASSASANYPSGDYCTLGSPVSGEFYRECASDTDCLSNFYGVEEKCVSGGGYCEGPWNNDMQSVLCEVDADCLLGNAWGGWPGGNCVESSCGNGIVEPLEACDDGSLNGTYGLCNSDCTTLHNPDPSFDCTGSLFSWDGATNTCSISASADMSGTTDALNIQAALNYINGMPNGTVKLGAETYHLSRGVVIAPDKLNPLLIDGVDDNYDESTGFSGSLIGAGMDQTIIEVVRKSAAIPFEYSYLSTVKKSWGSPLIPGPTLFHFQWPKSVTIEGMTMVTYDPNPAKGRLFVNAGVYSTALAAYVVAEGGNGDTVVRDVKMIGSAGDYNGLNVFIGMVTATGKYLYYPEGVVPSDDVIGTGNTTVEDSEFENFGAYGVLAMWAKDSNISIKRNIAKNIESAFDVWGMVNTAVEVTDNEINGASNGIYIWDIFAGPQVNIDRNSIIATTKNIANTNWLSNGAAIRFNRVENMFTTVNDNTITGTSVLAAIYSLYSNNLSITNNLIKDFNVEQAHRAAIYFFNTDNSLINKNTFENVLKNKIGTAGIRLRGSSANFDNDASGGNMINHNTFTNSGLPGWNIGNDYIGPGAIFLDPTYSSGTEVFEMKFPATQGKALCEMIMNFPEDANLRCDDGLGCAVNSDCTDGSSCELRPNVIKNWKPCDNQAKKDELKASLPNFPEFSERKAGLREKLGGRGIHDVPVGIESDNQNPGSCADGIDNDLGTGNAGDGYKDCQDYSCTKSKMAWGYSCETVCGWVKNWGTGYAFGCPENAPAEISCYDGKDNDNDGLIDFDDPDC